VITDSGGIQEETTYLGIPCLTLRTTTERPITITEGTNRLVTTDALVPAVDEILTGRRAQGRKPDLWDGHTATRVAADIRRRLLVASARDDESAAIARPPARHALGNA
jgi:UDP-N-acetylglucosamine 2-epimerase (non-hydrolysing)